MSEELLGLINMLYIYTQSKIMLSSNLNFKAKCCNK